MATEVTSPDVRRKEPGETINVAVDCRNILDKDGSIDETISSITSVAATGLTISAEAVTTVTRKIKGSNVPAGKAITFKVAGGSDGTTYRIKCTLVTSGSQTRIRYLTLEVTDDA